MSETLGNPAARRFHKVFMNKQDGNYGTSDLVALSGLSEKAILKKRKEVLGRAKLNRDQLRASECVRSLKDLFAIIQGYPDCGKTKLIGALAVYLVSLGFHVALGAATHEATENVIESTVEIIGDAKDDIFRKLRPVRIYRSFHEEKRTYNSQDDDSGEEAEPKETDEDLDLSSGSDNEIMIALLQELKAMGSDKSFLRAELSFIY